jgi:hypothetical protein
MSESLPWVRPKRCNASSACPEVAVDGRDIAIRSSAEPATVIRYTREEFAVFVEAAKDGEFDDLV